MGIKSLLYKLRGEIPTDILIQNGLKVGKNFNRFSGVIIDDSHCWLITIGDNVTIAPRGHILAHDASTKNETGYTRIGMVTIGSDVFIGAESIILPGVSIGDKVVIGAGSVVTKDIPSNSVAVGNPAKVIGTYDTFMEKRVNEMNTTVKFDETYTMRSREFGESKKQEMIQKLKENNGVGYVR